MKKSPSSQLLKLAALQNALNEGPKRNEERRSPQTITFFLGVNETVVKEDRKQLLSAQTNTENTQVNIQAIPQGT